MQAVSDGVTEAPPAQAGVQNLNSIQEEGTEPGQSGRRPDISLQIPPRPAGFSSSRSGKGLLQSQGSSKGSPLSGGLFRGLSFKKKRTLSDGEKSSLLNSDSSTTPESPIIANTAAAFSWQKCASLPVTPASNLSPSISTPVSARTYNERHKPHCLAGLRDTGFMAATTAAPQPSTTTPSKFNPKTVRKAVNALLKWRSSTLQTRNLDLLELDESTYLVFTLKKIPPKGRVNAYKIPLPNPLLSEFTEFCLIYEDGAKSKLTKDQIEKKIKADNIPITKTLKLSKLKSDYKAFEAKRKLMDSYDAFLADKQIVPLLPRLLGKQFFKKKRIPVPVDLQRKNWKEQVDRIVESSLLFLSTGTCSVVRVAKTSMSAEQIVENVVAAINGIVAIVPKKWSGVRSFHLKLLESLALPVYQAVPDETLLKIEGGKDSEKEVVKYENKDLKNAKMGKKGSISEVRYMDRNVGEVLDEDELNGVIVKKEKRKRESVKLKSEEAKLKKAKKSKNAAE